MSANGPADSSRWRNRVDELCDDYERDFREGRAAPLEDWLAKVPEDVRAQLLFELVALDCHLRLRAGEHVDLLEYRRKFPGSDGVFDDLEAELTALESDGDNGAVSSPESTITAPPQTEHFVKHFQLLSVLGQGGFGTVWRAVDTKLQREVALKIPRTDRLDQADLSAFLREARAAAKLRHPNIVAVYEVGDGNDESNSFIVTALVNGPNLKSWIGANEVAPRKAAELVATVARALHHAHENRVVHRDLKPGNILIDAEGIPHLADFGLAKREVADDSLAIDGQLVGTPNYMAPEQATANHAAIDRRTDIYALGVILYELLTGQPPFRGELAWLLEQIAKTPPTPPRKIKPTIPEDLEKICLKCLAKERSGRYQTAQELADDLHRFLTGESLRGVPVPMPKRVRKWFWRHRRFVTALAATVAVSLSVAGVAWWWSQPVTPRRLVKFETEPPGCEITAVRLDPETGEPNPDWIEHARDVTPLTMRLIPGDYLIVAVLKEDPQRFHEVLRHVPESIEGTPQFDRHLRWKADHNGAIVYPNLIVIPRPDVTVNMGFVEDEASWDPMLLLPTACNQPTSMPAFFVAVREELLEDRKPASRRYGLAIEKLEETGLRMPSAAEILYLQERLANQSINGKRGREDLRLQSHVITGLFEEPWEWTLTKPRANSESEVSSNPLGNGYRLVLGGSRPHVSRRSTGGSLELHAKILPEWQNASEVAVRGVRSARPRRARKDFIHFAEPLESQ